MTGGRDVVCGPENGALYVGGNPVSDGSPEGRLPVEQSARPRCPPDDPDILCGGPARQDVVALPEMAPHLQIQFPRAVGADDLHRGAFVVAEPARPPPRSTAPPALTHCPIGADGAADAEPARLSSPASRSAAPALSGRPHSTAAAPDRRRLEGS